MKTSDSWRTAVTKQMFEAHSQPFLAPFKSCYSTQENWSFILGLFELLTLVINCVLKKNGILTSLLWFSPRSCLPHIGQLQAVTMLPMNIFLLSFTHPLLQPRKKLIWMDHENEYRKLWKHDLRWPIPVLHQAEITWCKVHPTQKKAFWIEGTLQSMLWEADNPREGSMHLRKAHKGSRTHCSGWVLGSACN